MTFAGGVSKDGLNSSVDDAKAPNAIAAGKQYIDVSKPKVGDKIGFEFKHALAALKVTVDADVDVPSHADGELDGYTKIWVRSVTFNGFTDKGMLNLNADDSKPLWYDLSGINLIGSGGSVTIYDGRSDGKEGQTNADASNETPKDLNAKIVQNAPYDKDELGTQLYIDASHPGVTHTQVNLFNSDNTDPIYVIPTNDNLSVTIVYDVETYDPNLPTYLSDGVTRGSNVQNAITKEIKISEAAFKLEAGKQYVIALHLGMTSVKFEAEVTPWADGGTADNTDPPINDAPASVTAGGTLNANMGAAGGTYNFTFAGGEGALTKGTTTPAAQEANVTVSGTGENGAVTITANNSVNNINYQIAVTDNAATPQTVTINITQAAAALGLAAAAPLSYDNLNTITLTTSATAEDSEWDAATVTVTKNGTPLVIDTNFSFNSSTHVITLTDNATSTDVYTVTVSIGDVEGTINIENTINP